MRSVDFIYFRGCPNVARARAHLATAFGAIAAEPRWLEWDVSGRATPEEFRHYGSPTILINGRDVAGAASMAGGSGCRIYDDAGGLTGALLVEALCKTTTVPPRS